MTAFIGSIVNIASRSDLRGHYKPLACSLQSLQHRLRRASFHTRARITLSGGREIVGRTVMATPKTVVAAFPFETTSGGAVLAMVRGPKTMVTTLIEGLETERRVAKQQVLGFGDASRADVAAYGAACNGGCP